MAISTNDNILALLKTYYKDGVENLMFRNSPVVKEITKERVEGKTQNFSTMIGRGGAVGGNFLKAKQAATTTAMAREFEVTPGQLFSVYTMNAKEVQASKTLKGAYAPVAGAKMFACEEAFRKTMAAAFYGRGYGELCKSTKADAIQDGVAFDLTMPTHALMAIDLGSKLALKTSVDATTAKSILTVQKISGNKVTVMPKGAHAGAAVTDVICLDGSMDASGNPVLPMGIGGWIPTVAKRTGSTWTSYIGKDFFGVTRDEAPDRLAGAFYNGSSDHNIKDTVENVIQVARRQGSMADLIVMNDADFKKFTHEVNTNNTFMTQTSTKSKKNASVGFNSFSASFSTNYVENIYDDPYCPEGVIYILDKEYVKLWSYTNADVESKDQPAGNEPGKADIMEAGVGQENRPYGLIIDDYLNIAPGTDTEDGPSTAVSLMFYGTFVVTNPSVCAVAITSDYVDL